LQLPQGVGQAGVVAGAAFPGGDGVAMERLGEGRR
jgi:hypothetical protein